MKILATILGIAPILLFITPVYATVLLFEPPPGGSVILPPRVSDDYGDRVTATSQGGFIYGDAGGFTPNVVVSYVPAAEIRRWNSDFGDLQSVIFRGGPVRRVGGAGVLEVTMTADSPLMVTLTSFDMAGWPNVDYTINTVQVVDGFGTAHFSQDNALIQGDLDSGPRHSTFQFDPPLTSQSLTIRFDSSNLGSKSSYIGIDNITFGQVGQ